MAPVLNIFNPRMQSPFDVLKGYELRSQAKQTSMPEISHAHDTAWRGIGYRLGKYMLVSSFREVIEISRLPALTPVPGTQRWLLGLANLNGELLPVIGLRDFIEGSPTAHSEGQRVLIMSQPQGDLLLVVDEILGHRVFEREHAVLPGDEFTGPYSDFIDHAFYRDGQIWGVLSLTHLASHYRFQQVSAD